MIHVDPVCPRWTRISFSQNRCMPSWLGIFQFGSFFGCSKQVYEYILFGVFLRVLSILFHVIHPFSLSVIFFLFLYFTPILFCFIRIRLLVCLCAFSTHFFLEFSFVILEVPVLSLLLDPVPVSFESSFIRQYLLIYLFQANFQTCLQFYFGLFILI